MNSLLALSLLTASTTGLLLLGDGLTERFEAGTELLTTITRESSSLLDNSTILMGGSPVPEPGETTREVTASSTISYLDTIQDAPKGKLERFLRTYDEAEATAAIQMRDSLGGDHSADVTKTSQLEGIPIQFTREGGRFEASFPGDSEGDQDWLEPLTTSPNWRSLVPDPAAKVDDEWELDMSLLRHLREPGGDLAWEHDVDLSPIQGEIAMPPGKFRYSGEITATLISVEDDVAKVELEVEGGATMNLSELIPEEGLTIGDPASGMPIPMVKSVKAVYEIEGSGHFLWDLSRGGLSSLELDLELSEVLTSKLVVEIGGGEGALESVLTSTVTESIAVEVELQD